jgi:segregation and condensation protein B
LSDLPKPREIDEIMQDEDFLEQKRKIMMVDIEEKLEDSIGGKNGDESPDQ